MSIENYHIAPAVSLDESMKFEKVYPIALRLGRKNRDALLGSTIHLVHKDGQIVTEIILCPLDRIYDNLAKGHLCEPYKGLSYGYLLRVTTKNKFMNQGLASLLFNEALTYLVMPSKNFLGHYRENSYSVNIAKKLGSKELGKVMNWNGSGENFVLYETTINQ